MFYLFLCFIMRFYIVNLVYNMKMYYLCTQNIKI